MVNKRNEVRYPAQFKVKSFQYQTEAEIVFNEFMSIDITNLSKSGLGIETMEPLIVGSILTLNIHVDEINHSVVTKVKWCEPLQEGYQAGLQVVFISEQLKQKLNSLINEEYLFYN